MVVMAKSLRQAARGRFLPFVGCEVLASLLLSAAAAFAVGQLPSLEAVGKGAAQLSFAAVLVILGLCTAATPPAVWKSTAERGAPKYSRAARSRPHRN